jgi:tetratricopeptide (TPR) repeat protein
MTESTSVLDRAREAIDRKAWDKAYRLLSEADEGSRLDGDALPTLGDTAYMAGHPEVAIDAWERVHAAAVGAGEDERGAGAAGQVAALLLYTGLLAPARGWIRRAEDLLVEHPDSSIHGQLAVLLAWTSVLAGDLDGALQHARRAIDIGTRLGVPATRVLGRNAEARIIIFQGHLQEGLAVLDETAVAALSGELDPVSTALLYCSTVCAFQGLSEYDKAEEWTTAMERWCRRHATGGFHGLCRVHRAEILRLRGDWVDAEVEAREASEELRRYSRTDVGWASAELGQIRLRMGNLTGAEEASMPTSRGGTRIPVSPSFGSREELSRRPPRRSETRWSVSPRSPRSRPLPTPTSGVRPCWRHRSGSPSPQATWGTLARPPGTST